MLMDLTAKTRVREVSRREESASTFSIIFKLTHVHFITSSKLLRVTWVNKLHLHFFFYIYKPLNFLLIYFQWLEIYEVLSIDFLVSPSP